MNIEIKKLSTPIKKTHIKQMEVATWKTINKTISINPETQFFKVNDVFKFNVVIFIDHNNEWNYFPLHKYSLSVKGDDCYINNTRYMFINNKHKTEEFLKNINHILTVMTKVFF